MPNPIDFEDHESPQFSPSLADSNESKTKACPMCGEPILAIAKKCRHCGEYLDGSSRATAQTEARPSAADTTRNLCPFCCKEIAPSSTVCPHCTKNVGMANLQRRDPVAFGWGMLGAFLSLSLGYFIHMKLINDCFTVAIDTYGCCAFAALWAVAILLMYTLGGFWVGFAIAKLLRSVRSETATSAGLAPKKAEAKSRSSDLAKSPNFLFFLGIGVLLLSGIVLFLVWRSSIDPGNRNVKITFKAADTNIPYTSAYLLTGRAFSEAAANDPLIGHIQKALLLGDTNRQLSHCQMALEQQKKALPAVATETLDLRERIGRIKRLAALYQELIGRERFRASEEKEFDNIVHFRSKDGPNSQNITTINVLNGHYDKRVKEAERNLTSFARGSEVNELRSVWPSLPPKTLALELDNILATARQLSQLESDRSSLMQQVSQYVVTVRDQPAKHLPYFGKRRLSIKQGSTFVGGVADGNFMILIFVPGKVLFAPVVINSNSIEVALLDDQGGHTE